MNVDTGMIYNDPQEIAAAVEREEPLVSISQSFAQWVEGLSDCNRKKVARTLASIRRCQPHLSDDEAEVRARRTTVLSPERPAN